jgi:hypothetical protein
MTVDRDISIELEAAFDSAPRFKRAVRLESRKGEVEAEIEDDFHHFGVLLRHDGAEVTDVEAWAERFPWATCGGAAIAAKGFVGALLRPDPTWLYRHADAHLHCTHIFELTALALAQAAAGPGVRLYEAEVTDPVEGGRRARIWRDGALLMSCDLEGDVIIAPASLAGRSVFSFRSHELSGLGRDQAELFLLLRRVSSASRGRRQDLDAIGHLGRLPQTLRCYSSRPEQVAGAVRIQGATRDWSDWAGSPRAILSGPPAAKL